MSRVKVSKSKLWRAIRQYCLDCCCGSSKEVRECHIKTCPLWEFRLGRAKSGDIANTVPLE